MELATCKNAYCVKLGRNRMGEESGLDFRRFSAFLRLLSPPSAMFSSVKETILPPFILRKPPGEGY